MANKKEETALDRLQRLSIPSEEREYTLEEQMDSVSTDDFLDGMSVSAKNQLGHLFEEVTTDENTPSYDQKPIEPQTPCSDSVPQATVITNQEPIPEPIHESIAEPIMESTNDELFNNNKPKRGRPPKNHNESTTNNTHESYINIDTQSNPVFDQVAKDIIDTLRQNKFKINRFDDKSMEMIYNYMYTKF